ncbi:hypothetical protein BFS06_11995 [Clostridium perfringens]|uniref:Metal-dependent hydrolase n=1 Tax=Clostridium perfringens TaxID=1502 RepID=A0A140GQW7_CLOPF|nr:metal-dependent hydrolase [Clostridium perfringens]AMN30926.1 hypothetical protein JFP838_pA0010 [Clostridium perfringens]TBX14924.1 hypothetical protein BFS06_11995 [Clostridium perfringens]
MNYNAHRIGGVCFGIVSSCLIYQTPPTEEKLALSIILISGAYVGSLIPDLDHPKSYLGKKFKTLSNTLNKLFGHRGLTHTPIMYFIFSAILYLISVFIHGNTQIIYTQFAIGLSLGYLSHLFMDSLTKAGIPLLYPLKGYYSLAKFTTGQDDTLVSSLFIIFTGIFLIYFTGVLYI